MKLRQQLQELFMLLVRIENHEEKLSSDEISELQTRFKKLKSILKLHTSDKDGPQNDPEIYSSTNFPTIYCSLGDEKIGATLEELIQRTNLEKDELEKNLEQMNVMGLIDYDGSTQRYIAKDYFALYRFNKEEELFKNFYKTQLEELKGKVDDKFESDDNLFINICYSVKKEMLPSFKKDLRDLMYKYVTDTETTIGNTVAKLTVGFTNVQG